MTQQARHRWINLGKAALTIGILAYLVHKVPLRSLGVALANIRPHHVALLLALTIAQVTVSVVRWWRLLHRLGERVPFLAVYSDVLLGLTYNMFLPTTVGGDVVRAVRASSRTRAPGHAWSTSLYERIAGLLAMAFTAAIGAVAATSMKTAMPKSVQLLAVGVTLLLLVLFFAASAPFRFIVHVFESRLPEAAAGHVRTIVDDLEGPLSTFGARVEALGWSLGYQALGLAFCAIGARALGDASHDVGIVIGVPLVHVLSLAPITIGGLGLREQLFVTILGLLGVAAPVALGLGAQWLASSVGFALAGVAVALFESARGARV